VERFTDLMVRDVVTSDFLRADHLLEDHLGKLKLQKGVTPEQVNEYQKVLDAVSFSLYSLF